MVSQSTKQQFLYPLLPIVRAPWCRLPRAILLPARHIHASYHGRPHAVAFGQHHLRCSKYRSTSQSGQPYFQWRERYCQLMAMGESDDREHFTSNSNASSV